MATRIVPASGAAVADAPMTTSDSAAGSARSDHRRPTSQKSSVSTTLTTSDVASGK